MSRPIERHEELIDQIVLQHDLSHDFGRKRAYEAAIEYARENLADDPHCNEFLAAVAKRLGFAPITFDTIESRVKMAKGAWLDVWISDEDDEIALTGTREGLQYLIDLLTQLKNTPDREQHVHLDRGEAPMTDTSANLVLFKEDESWFTGVLPGGGEPFPEREIEESSVYAIQFIHHPPDDVPITPNRLYRVLAVTEVSGDPANLKEFPEGSEGRYRMFTFIADDGTRFQYAFHLDDPGVNLFTHREIMSLALQAL